MTKMTIEVSPEAHKMLLEEQYKRKIAGGKRTALAQIVSDILDEKAKAPKK
jgi:hypothetical protein